MYNLVRIILLLLVTTFAQAQEEGTTIELKIEHISNDDGQLLIGLYDSEDNWLKKRRMSALGQITSGASAVTFKNVPDGVYGVSLFHDENNNGKLDTNFLGIPKEDTGSSNNAPANFGPPNWEDAKFEVKGGVVKQIINL
ncbi:MAG: DUF2141 domain-containing protein [Maribacter sp.]